MIEVEHPYVMVLAIPLILILLFIEFKSKENYNRLKLYFMSIYKKPLAKVLLILSKLSKIIIIILLVILLAQPYITVKKETVLNYDDIAKLKTRPYYVILVDVSKSMNYGFEGATRLKKGLEFIKKILLNLNQSDVVIIILFSRDVRIFYNGTIAEAYDYIEQISGGERYSAIGDALAFAYNLVKLRQLPSIIFLLSDGGFNYGSNPIEVANMIGGSNITLVVFHVGIGASSNAALLREISDVSKGYFFEITDELPEDIYEEIGKETTFQAYIRSGFQTVCYTSKDYSTPGLVLGLILLLFVMAEYLYGG